MKSVYIFGAGASYGCGGILPEQPPLGNNLFLSLKRLFPRTWGALPDDVCSIINNDFEAGMKVIWDKYGTVISPLMCDMAIFFAHYRRSGETLYDKLIHIDAACGINAVYSTLNYECIFEQCLSYSGTTVGYFGAHGHNVKQLYKLHGSCNFFSNSIQTAGVAYGTGVSFEGGIEAVVDMGELVGRCLGNGVVAPSMCLYMQGKPVNTSPSVIQTLQDNWKNELDDADYIVIIGIRPVMADSHIWGPIIKSKAQILYCGDRATVENWSAASGKAFAYMGPFFHNAIHYLERRYNGNIL